jgi:endonuclease YncB( thermonuclease family)
MPASDFKVLMPPTSFNRYSFTCRFIAYLVTVLFGALSFQSRVLTLNAYDDTASRTPGSVMAVKVAETPLKSQSAQPRQALEVVRIFDGDSAIVRYEGESETLHVRIVGIVAPEKGQPHADESRDKFVALLKSPTTRIEILKRDVFRRWLVRAEVNGEDLGERMLREGNAWFFRRYQSDLSPEMRRRYDRAERKAQAKKLGLWQNSNPMAPWDFRASRRKPKD